MRRQLITMCFRMAAIAVSLAFGVAANLLLKQGEIIDGALHGACTVFCILMAYSDVDRPPV